MTIIDAIRAVMEKAGQPMTAQEIFNEIISNSLYEFKAQRPKSVVVGQIRRHCVGIDFASANETKYFELVSGNRYVLLKEPLRLDLPKQDGVVGHQNYHPRRDDPLGAALEDLKQRQEHYESAFRDKLAYELRSLPPEQFEHFARGLLTLYGFRDVIVTQQSGDGGIDGHGKLRVGLADLQVAFQCKRWTKGNIQRTEIDKFRGAAQGDYEQGVFFATTNFSTGAINASIKRGAIPIVLVNLDLIITMMIEKEFGVQIERLAVPTYALDLAISADT